MRVFLTSPYSLQRIAGVGRFVEELGTALSKLGASVFVITPKSVEMNTRRAPGAITLRMRVFRNFELTMKTLSLILRYRSTRDILHCQHVNSQTFAVCLLGKVLGRPTVLTLHGSSPPAVGILRRAAQIFFAWASIRLASRVVAVSIPTAQSYTGRPIDVVSNGVDTERYRPVPKVRELMRRELGLEGKLVFIFAGRWAFVKGLDLLLEVAASGRLAGRSYHLLVTGESAVDEPDFMERSLRKNPKSSNVSIIGRVDELPPLLNAADVFVLPSRGHEGLSLGLLEALSTGLPALVSDLPVHRALIEEVGCGWTFRAGDLDAMESAMSAIIAEGIPPDWPSRARSMVLERYTLKSTAEQYLAMYHELLDPHKNLGLCASQMKV